MSTDNIRKFLQLAQEEVQKRGVQLSIATEKSEAEDKDKESCNNREDKSNKKEEVEGNIKPTAKEVIASNAGRMKSFDMPKDECQQSINRKYTCHPCRSNGKNKDYWGFSLFRALKKALRVQSS